MDYLSKKMKNVIKVRAFSKWRGFSKSKGEPILWHPRTLFLLHVFHQIVGSSKKLLHIKNFFAW